MGALKDILAISGQPGLFKFVSQGRNGIIVESFETGKRTNATASAKISALEDIAVFTDDGEVQLEEVFKKMQEKLGEEEAMSSKSSSDQLKAFFEEILPEYDRDRVYVSDMKKMVKWYNQLLKLDMLHFEDATEEDQENKDNPDKTDNKREAETSSSPEKE